ncbi:MAG: alpha/beta hydrolase family esterase [Ilumatobacteraceae bacterium]
MAAVRGYRLALGVLLVLAGCSASNTSDVATSTSEVVTSSTSSVEANQPDAQANAVAPEGYSSISTNDGRSRIYKVVDLSNGEDDVPMLLVLHGFGGSGAAMSSYTSIESALADAGIDAVVVYPEGTGAETGSPQSWNAGGCCPFAMFEPVDDVGFFSKLISTVETDYSTDSDRVWVIGHSNGGMMGYRLACELADKISAIGVAAGALMLDSCTPTRAVDVLHLHGDLDAVVPLNGGNALGIEFPSTRQSIDHYADAAGCAAALTSTSNFVERTCATKRVVLTTDANWTHDWQPDWSRRFVEFFAATSGA